MNESTVRSALVAELQAAHFEEAGTIGVSELPIYYGSVRADLCVVNGELTGYEIKTAVDSVARLPRQAEHYRQVFDRLCFVVAEKHLQKTLALVPEHAGIFIISSHGESLAFEVFRPARENDELNPATVATFLWRDEAISVCKRYGIAQGITSKPRRDLWARLAADMPFSDLRSEVRAALKARHAWDRVVFRIGRAHH